MFTYNNSIPMTKLLSTATLTFYQKADREIARTGQGDAPGVVVTEKLKPRIFIKNEIFGEFSDSNREER